MTKLVRLVLVFRGRSSGLQARVNYFFLAAFLAAFLAGAAFLAAFFAAFFAMVLVPGLVCFWFLFCYPVTISASLQKHL